MSTSQNILIIGGTGLIGEHISNAIVASRQHFVRIALFGKFYDRYTIGLVRHLLTFSQYVPPLFLHEVNTFGNSSFTLSSACECRRYS